MSVGNGTTVYAVTPPYGVTIAIAHGTRVGTSAQALTRAFQYQVTPLNVHVVHRYTRSPGSVAYATWDCSVAVWVPVAVTTTEATPPWNGWFTWIVHVTVTVGSTPVATTGPPVATPNWVAVASFVASPHVVPVATWNACAGVAIASGAARDAQRTIVRSLIPVLRRRRGDPSVPPRLRGMTAALALLASIVWGVADFLGGSFSRRLHTAYVMLWSACGALVAIALLLALGAWRTPGAYLWWGIGASVFGTVGVAFFYRALAIGTMSVVAPIAGTALVVPVVAGLLGGERPSLLQLLGIALATVGVVLASGPELRGIGDQRLAVFYACGAAVGFGGALALMPHAGSSRWGMTTLAVNATGFAAVLAYVLTRRPPGPVLPRRDVPGVVGIGLLNVAAVGLYSYASGRGLVAVVAVLASLYSVVTVLLAQVVYGERLRGVQLGGVLVAFGGVVCLAAG